jgi:hypothetical protein
MPTSFEPVHTGGEPANAGGQAAPTGGAEPVKSGGLKPRPATLSAMKPRGRTVPTRSIWTPESMLADLEVISGHYLAWTGQPVSLSIMLRRAVHALRERLDALAENDLDPSKEVAQMLLSRDPAYRSGQWKPVHTGGKPVATGEHRGEAA